MGSLFTTFSLKNISPLTIHDSPFTIHHLHPPLPEYFNIGKLVAVHGLKGELVLEHNLGKKTSLKGLTTLFIEERKDSFLPWFIESTRIKSEDEVFVKLETVDTREAAAKLTPKPVWIPEADFKKFTAKNAPMNLLGYTLIDHGKPLGPILEVIEQPHQLLCRLEINGKELLAPLMEATLVKIDHKKREVKVELPEGLVEMYVGN